MSWANFVETHLFMTKKKKRKTWRKKKQKFRIKFPKISKFLFFVKIDSVPFGVYSQIVRSKCNFFS